MSQNSIKMYVLKLSYDIFNCDNILSFLMKYHQSFGESFIISTFCVFLAFNIANNPEVDTTPGDFQPK